MAKGNLFLGFGRGKVGDVVFSRVGGEQVTRARNRAPRNPQTPLQLLQRVVLKTSSSAFSMMQEICNHSFQGEEGVTQNQAAFNRANVKLFRTQLATEINSGDPDVILTSSETNFTPKDEVGAAINPYIVSQGKLPKVEVSWWNSGSEHDTEAVPQLVATVEWNVSTYEQLISKLGLQQGDQLTVLALTCDDTAEGSSSLFKGFHYGRFILDPDDGDLTHTLADTTHWNPKNENIAFRANSGTSGVFFMPDDVKNFFDVSTETCVVGYAVIASRWTGNAWARSDAQLIIKPWTVGDDWHLQQDHGEMLLSDAILSYMDDSASLLYLNQAET